MGEFNVLVVDDSRELIEKLGSRVSPHHKIGGEPWDVTFNEVHIELHDNPEGLRFSAECLQRLIAACQHPPDLILADFGFSTPRLLQQLEDGLLSAEEFSSRLLTPAHLIPALKSAVNPRSAKSASQLKQLDRGLFANPCRLYLYTYTDPRYRAGLPTPDARAKLTQRAFPRSEVILVDISQELYENGAFDSSDRRFRAYLTSGLLAQLIHRELLQAVLRDTTERMRFVRYQRSGAGVLVIVLIGGAIGAVGEWIGSRVMALIGAGFWTTALAFVGVTAVSFFVLGLLLPLFFERLMSKLLTELRKS